MTVTTPAYLDPYLRAAKLHGSGFSSLLWACQETQEVRFDALMRAVDLNGRKILDVGCGRGDLIDFLDARGVQIAQYAGIEAVDALASAAEEKGGEKAHIIRGDFVGEPGILNVGADVILFSGSLNTLDTRAFYQAIRNAFDVATHAVAFNFLSSPLLAGRSYLFWHHPNEVMQFARQLSPNVRRIDDYLEGDCTIAIERSAEPK